MASTLGRNRRITREHLRGWPRLAYPPAWAAKPREAGSTDARAASCDFAHLVAAAGDNQGRPLFSREVCRSGAAARMRGMQINFPPPVSLLFMASATTCLGSIAVAIVRRRFSLRVAIVVATSACIAAASMRAATGWTY